MNETETKQEVFGRLLEQGVTALHLDPRRGGVDVPAHLVERPWLVLNFSYQYHIDDFEFDDNTVVASLSFQGTPYPCRVPWSAVFGITDGSQQVGRLWEDDLPAEVIAQQQAALDAEDETRPPADAVAPRPLAKPAPVDADRDAGLEAAPGADESGPARGGLRVLDGGSESEATPSTPRRGHLRRIK